MNPPWIYIDTSAYLKIFLKEKGSDKVRKLVKENSLLASAIPTSECFSAFSRRRQGKEIDDKTFDRLVSRVKKDLPLNSKSILREIKGVNRKDIYEIPENFRSYR